MLLFSVFVTVCDVLFCRISSPNVQQRAIEWKTLSSLLSTYEMLYNNEQAFLMEV